LYAVVVALEKFRCYLYGRQFTVFTDHRALLWLCGKKKVNERLLRWSLQISAYAQNIRFVHGKNNHVADALSRTPYQPEPEGEDTEPEQENPGIADNIRFQVYRDGEKYGFHRPKEEESVDTEPAGSLGNE
jgi:hypothetical protein